MKKKLLTLIAVFGLSASSLAMAPHADAEAPVSGAPVPGAEVGWAVVHYGWDYMGWNSGSLAYDIAMGASQGAFAAIGGFLGSSLGPIGTFVGGGIGGA